MPPPLLQQMRSGKPRTIISRPILIRVLVQFLLSSMPRRIGMFLPFFYLINLPWSLANPLSLPTTSPRATGLHLPLSRREINISTPQRINKRGAIGLGDYFDVCVFERGTAASSPRNQNIQCTSSNRRDACTSRHR